MPPTEPPPWRNISFNDQFEIANEEAGFRVWMFRLGDSIALELIFVRKILLWFNLAYLILLTFILWRLW
jgi:hypothetical protein